MKLAIIDDERPTLKIMKTILDKVGYECSVFDNPKTAFEKIKSEKIDVIITDYKMPEVTGLEVLKKIKSKNPDKYVIMISAFADKYNALTALYDGAYSFFRKPVKINELIELLAKIEKEIQIKDNINKTI